MAVKLPGLFSKTRFCEKIWKAVCSRGKKREDMEDRKSTAKAEYEAELYRQTHPYEQWIAENEKENRGDGPDGTEVPPGPSPWFSHGFKLINRPVF